MGVGIGVPKIWGTLWPHGGMADPVEVRPYPHVSPCQMRSFSVKRYTIVIMENCQENDSSRPAFAGGSR